MPRYFPDELLRRLRNDIAWASLLKQLEWPHKLRDGQLVFLCPRCQRVPLGGQPAYESRPLLPLRSQLQPDRFHDGRAAMRLRNRGPLSGTALATRPPMPCFALNHGSSP